jgi:hypothetical protein
MSVDEATLNQFIVTARKRGTVSIDELRYAFSIEAMDAEDVAAIVARLEEADVSVEIDPKLFSPKYGVPLNTMGSSKSLSPQNTISTGPTTRISSTIQGVRAGKPMSKGTSSADSGNKYLRPASLPGKFLVWLAAVPVAIGAFAVRWLSKL